MAARKPPVPAKSRPKTSTAAPVAERPAPASSTGTLLKPAARATHVPATPEPTKPKHKLVRDSFTIPKSEYAVLGGLKQRALRLAHPAKKSELLRAGISALNAMSDRSFLAALGAVPSLKTGRPKKEAIPSPTASLRKP